MKTTYLNQKYFRKNTRHEKVFINFNLCNGGLGDYINFMPAFEWLASENPHVEGRIFVTQPFLDVARFIMRDYKHWTVEHPDDAERLIKPGEGIFDPSKWEPYINATGAHLLDLGFMFYACKARAFESHNRLPDLTGYEDCHRVLGGKPHAVLTPGATADARRVPAKYFNEIIDYIISKNIVPVFLGKKDFHVPRKGSENLPHYTTKFDDGINYHLGIDLRERTTLLQATQIMKHSSFVLGVDNGLLHFAGTTDVPIIFGHTVASVKEREIRRPKGTTINIEVPRELLSCIGCQSNMRLLVKKDSKGVMRGHQFHTCIYGDNACIDALFIDNCETWKKAIDHVIEKHNERR